MRLILCFYSFYFFFFVWGIILLFVFALFYLFYLTFFDVYTRSFLPPFINKNPETYINSLLFNDSMKLVITIPAYNEEQTLGGVLTSIKKVMQKTDYSYQILVVDDGSTDKTVAVAKAAGAIVFSHPRNYGLAEAFRTEMKQCLALQADIILHTDADGQYHADDIPLLLKKIEEGYDLVLGSRFLGTIESMPLIKRWGNKAFSRVISNISGMRITDGQTGFRVFTHEVAQIPITSNHTYTQEQVIRAVQEKFRVAEVPVYFAERKGSKSRLIRNPFEYASKAWINILRIYRDYKPLKFFGLFGGFLFLIGFLIGSYAAVLWILTDRVGGVPRVVLSGVLMLVGIQVILFGFLADMNKR